MSFGFLDPVKLNTNPNAVTGNFSLGVFNLKSECYNELKTALEELVVLLSAMEKITICGKEYKIEFWLGGDLKFLALVLGMHTLYTCYPRTH